MLSALAVLTSLTVLVSSVGGYLLAQRYDGQVERIPRVFPDDRRPQPAPRDPRTILVVGSDSRSGLQAGEGTQGSGEEFVEGQRSDTMILVHLYGGRDLAELISLPRDSWVTIPAHTDPSGRAVPAAQAKLNAAFEQGGPALLIRTIEAMSSLRIDHYAQVDFDGFLTLVDTLGGVEVCLSEPARDEVSGIDLPAGRQTVSGPQALAYVRQRAGLPRGDLDRIARQQQFLGSIVRKTLSAGTLLNPFRLDAVLDVTTDALQVDSGTSLDDLRDLALRLRTFQAGGIVFDTLPVADIDARRDRQAVVLLDQPRVRALFARLRADLPPGSPGTRPAPPPPLIVEPRNIRVRVINGSGVPGLGQRAFDELASAGFLVVDRPVDRGRPSRTTTVFHGPERADSARTLAAAVPGARTRLDPARGRVLDLVVGSGWAGTRPVRVTPPGGPVPATAPPTTAAQDPCVV